MKQSLHYDDEVKRYGWRRQRRHYTAIRRRVITRPANAPSAPPSREARTPALAVCDR